MVTAALSTYTVIAAIGRDDEAEAAKWTGDPVVAPGAGEVTVTPAKATADIAIMAARPNPQRCNRFFNNIS